MTGKSKIFGGYTNIPWKREGGCKIMDSKSFLFSVRDDGSIVVLNSIQGKEEVRHNKGDLLNFYQSFKIMSDCNEHMKNWAYIKGGAYSKPPNLDKNSEECHLYLNHGSSFLQVKELEVYLITKKVSKGFFSKS